jgi:hypothetical protein
MSTTEAAYASHLHQWLPSQPKLHEPCIRVKALGRGKELPFDCWTAFPLQCGSELIRAANASLR